MYRETTPLCWSDQPTEVAVLPEVVARIARRRGVRVIEVVAIDRRHADMAYLCLARAPGFTMSTAPAAQVVRIDSAMDGSIGRWGRVDAFVFVGDAIRFRKFMDNVFTPLLATARGIRVYAIFGNGVAAKLWPLPHDTQPETRE